MNRAARRRAGPARVPSCGIQPNLLATLMPALDRDDIEHFLWMFFNNWVSCYSKMSCRYTAHENRREMAAKLIMKVRKVPKKILVRFRHPEERIIISVRVNGKTWKSFNAKKGDVNITGLSGPVKVIARFP